MKIEAGEVTYDLGKRHFSSAVYGEFGAEGVDTIEKSRKKLRAEAFGGEAQLERVLFDKNPTLHKDLPQLLPPHRMALLQSKTAPAASAAATGSAAAPVGSFPFAPKVPSLPRVSWNLLDAK